MHAAGIPYVPLSGLSSMFLYDDSTSLFYGLYGRAGLLRYRCMRSFFTIVNVLVNLPELEPGQKCG